MIKTLGGGITGETWTLLELEELCSAARETELDDDAIVLAGITEHMGRSVRNEYRSLTGPLLIAEEVS